MPTFTPSLCRHCAHWLRRESGEDCARGLLVRQTYCWGFEREPGADDDLTGDGDGTQSE